MAKKAAAASTSRTDKKAVERTVFIVNRSGAVHEVNASHARERLRDSRGFRMATAAEIEAYKAAGGYQSAEHVPIGAMSDEADEANDNE